MKRQLFSVIGILVCCVAALFLGACRSKTGAGGGSGPLTLEIAPDGWPRQWHAAPTAAQSGIKSFSEAPMLAELVKGGQLPPVEQRIPTEDALVIQSLDGQAVYGGTLRGARLSPSEYGDGVRAQLGYLFRCDPTMTEMVPYIAKGYQINDASDAITIYLRRGSRWSDGQPFTADDIMFIYDEIWNNPDMVSFWGYPGSFIFDGKRSVWRKLDDHSVEIKFPKPLSTVKIISLFNLDMDRYYFTPAHHIKQYMPKYNPNAIKLAAEEDFTVWQQAVAAHMSVDPGRRFIGPELGPWATTSITDRGSTYERNPYFIAVDEKGRQLPYIDRFVTRIYTDSQVAIMDAMQGNVDFVGRMLEPSNLPIYKENEARGNYTTYEWFSTKMSYVSFRFNLTYSADLVLRDLMRDVRFRRALSLAMNREEINKLVFLGLAKPQQMTIDQSTSFYQQGWDQLYAKYDLAGAKQLLADMGLKAGRDGVLLRPDGKPLELTLIVSTESLVGPIGQKITELVAQYWREAGVQCIVKQQETGLFNNLISNGDLQVYIYPSEDDLEVRSLANKWSYGGGMSKKPLGYAPEWGKWFSHQEWINDGRIGAEPPRGEEPPQEIKDHYANYLWYAGASSDKEYQEYALKFWSFLMDQLPAIGTVGKPPAPVMINNRVKNILPEMPFSFESFLWQTPTPYQWYLSDGK